MHSPTLSTITSYIPFFKKPANAPATPPNTPPRSFSPPIRPVDLVGYASDTSSRLLSPALSDYIRGRLPARQSLYTRWTLAYSLEQHGASLKTLYERCARLQAKYGADSPGGTWIVAVSDKKGDIVGAAVDQPLVQGYGRYVGSGECFLFRYSHEDCDLSSTLSDVENDDNNDSGFESDSYIFPSSSPPQKPKVRPRLPRRSSSHSHYPCDPYFYGYRHTGENNLALLCDHEGISFGGGDNGPGLFIDSSLETALTAECETFDNKVLTGDEDERTIDIWGLEVWRVG